MAVPALNVYEIAKIKEIASEYKLSVADFVRETLRECSEREKNTRILNIEEASPEESAELLALIDSMTEDDRQIVRVHKI